MERTGVELDNAYINHKVRGFEQLLKLMGYNGQFSFKNNILASKEIFTTQVKFLKIILIEHNSGLVIRLCEDLNECRKRLLKRKQERMWKVLEH